MEERGAQARGLWFALRTTFRDGLFRSSAYLTLNEIAGAALGSVLSPAAARLYPEQEVGLGVARLSVAALLAILLT